MKYLAIIAIFCALLASTKAASLQACPYESPDQVTQILPGYTAPVQPCSYSGFAPLDQNNNSALFYWYFPAQLPNRDELPMLVWLQGGPGASSMFAFFAENGPYKIHDNLQIEYLDAVYGTSWAYFYNVIWIDSPVGTGFSYTTEEYSHTEDDLALKLVTAVNYIQSLHPQTVNQKWFYTGESYAGRYIPAFAYWTLKTNEEIDQGLRDGNKINLQGVVIGGAFVHGVVQRLATIEAAGTATMVSPDQRSQVNSIGVNCQQLFSVNDTRATDVCNSINSYITDVSGIDTSAASLPRNVTDAIGAHISPYLNQQVIYDILHVSGSKKNSTELFSEGSSEAYNALKQDIIFNNSLVFVNYIVTKIPTLIFEGNFDIGDGAIGVQKWMPLLDGEYSKIMEQTRNVWFLQGVPVGMVTIYENLTYVIVDFSGHYTPYFVLNVSVSLLDVFTQGGNNWDPFHNSTDIVKTMCDAMNNCNGNGVCQPNGLCKCNVGWALGDCSQLAEVIGSHVVYDLVPRAYKFLSVVLNGAKKIARISGDVDIVDIHYVGSGDGPIADPELADVNIYASDSTKNYRFLYLNAVGPNAYITVHNVDYNKNAQITIDTYGA